MHKKLILACMAIAAFAAFVIAPAASASPELNEGGSTVAVGSSIKATNTGDTRFTLTKGGSAVVCTHAEFKGSVTGNTGTKVKGEIPLSTAEKPTYTFSGTGEGGDCTSPIGVVKPTLTSKLCLETAAEDKVLVTGCGGNVTFSLDVTKVTTCKYSTASVIGSYATPLGSDATVNVSEGEAGLAEPNFLCPSAGWLDMDFDLTTTDGTTLTVS